MFFNLTSGLIFQGYYNIWIATQKGLNRFDGNNFLHFYADGTNNSLPQDDIKQLKWINKEQLGIVTPSGLHIVEPGTLKQRNIKVLPDRFNSEYGQNNIQGIAGDAKGNMFLLTSTGFYHFNSKEELVFSYDYYRKEDAGKIDVPWGKSDGLIMPESNTLLLETEEGLYVYQINQKNLHPIGKIDDSLYRQIVTPGKKINFFHCSGLSFSVSTNNYKQLFFFDIKKKKKYNILTSLTGLDILFNWRSKITPLNDTSFIINAAQRGFYIMRYDKDTDNYIILPQVYLDGYAITSVIFDKSSRLWIGTTKGLLKQRRNADRLEKIIVPDAMNPDGSNLNIRTINSVGNKLFIGTIGKGVMVFDRNNLQPLKTIDLSGYIESGSSNDIFNLATINNNSLYAGTNGPLINIDPITYRNKIVSLPDWEKYNWIAGQFISRQKTCYVTSDKYKCFYYRYDGEKSFSIRYDTVTSLFNILTPMHIAEDNDGNIWFAGHGISRFNIKEHEFDILLDSFPKIKTTGKDVMSLAIDKNGKLYFGAGMNGLIIYDLLQSKFENITRNDGLPGNLIRSLYIHDSKLWMGTEGGLASYDINSKKISSFGIADEMPEGPVTTYNFYYDSLQHKLYCGFSNTILRFNPDSLVKNISAPLFFIESISIAGKDTIFHPADKLELSYKYNSIIINLASVNFEDAYQQQFAYRFVKDESTTDNNHGWQDIGSQRSIIFSNLSSGKYHLQVKVFIRNNSWPEEVKEISIVIQPPFWKSVWFILLFTSIVFVILFLLSLTSRLE